MSVPRTDAEIIDETNALARYLCADLIGTGYQVPADHKFYEADDPRSKKAWAHAVEIMEMTTKTEMADVLATLDEAEPKRLYRIRLRETVYYTLDVEAGDENEAGDIARETWALSEDPSGDFEGQSEGVTVNFVEAVGG